MSIEDATSMLWQEGSIPILGFSIYKIAVLKELVACHRLAVGQSGKAGRSLKSDYVEAVSKYRVQIEAERFVTPSVVVRVYKNPKDWQHNLEEAVNLEANGDLCLGKVTRPEGYLGQCRVIDPRNYAPFFAYRPGYVEAGDFLSLLDEGYLRVTYIK